MPEDAVVRSNRDGIASSVAQFSFPQRFLDAYAEEVRGRFARGLCLLGCALSFTVSRSGDWWAPYVQVDHFADIVLNGATPLVTERDCVQAQRIAQAALQSFNEGRPVSLA